VNLSDPTGKFIPNEVAAAQRVATAAMAGIAIYELFEEEIITGIDGIERLWQDMMDEAAIRSGIAPRTYITYSLYNSSTHQTYFGRASGYGDPLSVFLRRMASHHMLAFGFQPQSLDQAAIQGVQVGPYGAYEAIRGREQQLMDRLVMAEGRSMLGNRIGGIPPLNGNLETYFNASNAWYGNIAPMYVPW
jgi:hypothetical protein